MILFMEFLFHRVVFGKTGEETIEVTWHGKGKIKCSI